MKNVTIYQGNLISEFYKEYEAKNGKFLLFDLANANENANTKVLKCLLKNSNCHFLNSFLGRIGLPRLPQGPVCITDQKKAIGPEDTGFIDLYIQYDDIHVIIENKIYGAGDAKKQLARYIATVNGVEINNFNKWYDIPSVDKDIHVVYLTADGTKEPSDDSLPSALKDKINYYAVNYKDLVLPWLEEDVLPNLTYGTDGLMIAGVQQYIAFLKQFLAEETSEVVNTFVSGLQGKKDVEKYTTLLGVIDKNTKAVPENVQKSLRKQLEARAEAIFSGDVEGEWVLHFTPTYINLYKKSWANLDARKYSIPSLFIFAGNTKAFLNNGCLNTLKLGVAHLARKTKENYTNTKYERLFGNHDMNIGITLLDNPRLVDIKCDDINDAAARKKFYREIIKAIQSKVEIIDKGVSELLNSGTPTTPEVILKMVLDSQII
ncbi:MAG: PD-(D/E)XK nuclease family protein [Prevotellamassilia sp.]|nr:PD-(D/E)XK nuclease family protein [Prevotellamassilia sp.]